MGNPLQMDKDELELMITALKTAKEKARQEGRIPLMIQFHTLTDKCYNALERMAVPS